MQDKRDDQARDETVYEKLFVISGFTSTHVWELGLRCCELEISINLCDFRHFSLSFLRQYSINWRVSLLCRLLYIVIRKWALIQLRIWSIIHLHNFLLESSLLCMWAETEWACNIHSKLNVFWRCQWSKLTDNSSMTFFLFDMINVCKRDPKNKVLTTTPSHTKIEKDLTMVYK